MKFLIGRVSNHILQRISAISQQCRNIMGPGSCTHVDGHVVMQMEVCSKQREKLSAK